MSAPHVEFVEIPAHGGGPLGSVMPAEPEYSGFKSWIPGGTIDEFEWTWQTGAAWFSLVGSSSDQHRFTVPKPPGIVTANQICLRKSILQVAHQCVWIITQKNCAHTALSLGDENRS